MPKAEAGSAKAIGNAMKARGLTKLRFYCQVCEKANRDEHAYKMHCESESHTRRLALVGSNPNKVIDDFSKQFLDEFVSLLSRRFGTRRIKANQVYQEYIAERHHLHMNATKWVSLTEFVKHLGREGIAHVEESEQGWFLSWIDNSPAALKRQAALQKMERAKMDEEGRERKRLKEQIQKATQQHQPTEPSLGSSLGLNRSQDAGPIRLGIGMSSSSSGNKTDDEQPSPTSTSQPEVTTKPSISFSAASSNPLRSNPLKQSSPLKSNPLKSISSTPTPSSSSSSSSSHREPRTMAEKIRLEEQQRRSQQQHEKDKRKAVGPMPSSSAAQGIKRIRM
ncbi:unnamed protein product [Sympodiomycopsis kandeliae]